VTYRRWISLYVVFVVIPWVVVDYWLSLEGWVRWPVLILGYWLGDRWVTATFGDIDRKAHHGR
jgi:hypothetical protein